MLKDWRSSADRLRNWEEEPMCELMRRVVNIASWSLDDLVDRVVLFKTGFGLVITLAHNTDMTDRALVVFAVTVPRPGVTDFTAGNGVARS